MVHELSPRHRPITVLRIQHMNQPLARPRTQAAGNESIGAGFTFAYFG